VGRDLTGKVAVVHSVLQPDPFSQSARGHIEAVIEAGAVGVLTMLDANLWYHSTGDRLDAIHPDGLERATRLYAYVLDKIDSSSRAELTEKGR